MDMNFQKNLLIKSVLILALVLGSSLAFASDEHKITFHIDEKNEKKMHLVLNNTANVIKYYQNKGDEVTVEVVAYGPGLHMLRSDTSPKKVQKRIKSFEQNFENVSFRACSNTQRKMSKKAGKDVKLLSQAKMVPSGVVHLVERQEAGWSYIRP